MQLCALFYAYSWVLFRLADLFARPFCQRSVVVFVFCAGKDGLGNTWRCASALLWQRRLLRCGATCRPACATFDYANFLWRLNRFLVTNVFKIKELIFVNTRIVFEISVYHHLFTVHMALFIADFVGQFSVFILWFSEPYVNELLLAIFS